MSRYAVWIEQINQERIEVDAESRDEARRKALKIWQEECAIPIIEDTMLLPDKE